MVPSGKPTDDHVLSQKLGILAFRLLQGAFRPQLSPSLLVQGAMPRISESHKEQDDEHLSSGGYVVMSSGISLCVPGSSTARNSCSSSKAGDSVGDMSASGRSSQHAPGPSNLVPLCRQLASELPSMTWSDDAQSFISTLLMSGFTAVPPGTPSLRRSSSDPQALEYAQRSSVDSSTPAPAQSGPFGNTGSSDLQGTRAVALEQTSSPHLFTLMTSLQTSLQHPWVAIHKVGWLLPGGRVQPRG